jgi:hypothetical protein
MQEEELDTKTTRRGGIFVDGTGEDQEECAGKPSASREAWWRC